MKFEIPTLNVRKSEKKKVVGCAYDNEEYKKLKELASKHNCTMAYIIKLAVRFAFRNM